jgi:hypothetical protein
MGLFIVEHVLVFGGIHVRLKRYSE